jgi:hypothetical protein
MLSLYVRVNYISRGSRYKYLSYKIISKDTSTSLCSHVTNFLEDGGLPSIQKYYKTPMHKLLSVL